MLTCFQVNFQVNQQQIILNQTTFLIYLLFLSFTGLIYIAVLLLSKCPLKLINNFKYQHTADFFTSLFAFSSLFSQQYNNTNIKQRRNIMNPKGTKIKIVLCGIVGAGLAQTGTINLRTQTTWESSSLPLALNNFNPVSQGQDQTVLNIPMFQDVGILQNTQQQFISSQPAGLGNVQNSPVLGPSGVQNLPSSPPSSFVTQISAPYPLQQRQESVGTQFQHFNFQTSSGTPDVVFASGATNFPGQTASQTQQITSGQPFNQNQIDYFSQLYNQQQQGQSGQIVSSIPNQRIYPNQGNSVLQVVPPVSTQTSQAPTSVVNAVPQAPPITQTNQNYNPFLGASTNQQMFQNQFVNGGSFQFNNQLNGNQGQFGVVAQQPFIQPQQPSVPQQQANTIVTNLMDPYQVNNNPPGSTIPSQVIQVPPSQSQYFGINNNGNVQQMQQQWSNNIQNAVNQFPIAGGQTTSTTTINPYQYYNYYWGNSNSGASKTGNTVIPANSNYAQTVSNPVNANTVNSVPPVSYNQAVLPNQATNTVNWPSGSTYPNPNPNTGVGGLPNPSSGAVVSSSAYNPFSADSGYTSSAAPTINTNTNVYTMPNPYTNTNTIINSNPYSNTNINTGTNPYLNTNTNTNTNTNINSYASSNSQIKINNGFPVSVGPTYF